MGPMIGNVPPFLAKLWEFVNHPKSDDLIAWSNSEDSFIIKDGARFANELLPEYFRHNNMRSFLKQLSNYGFKKVADDEKSGLKNESNQMEFRQEFNYFVKEKEDLLQLVNKKMPKVLGSKERRDTPSNTNIKDILRDINSTFEKQENNFLKLKKEHKLLSKELSAVRQEQKVQEVYIQLNNILLRHVISEVTDEANRCPASILKSPAAIHVAESPASQDENDGSSKPDHPFAKNLSVPEQQLGILEALRERFLAESRDENNQNKSILGILLGYIANQGSTEMANVTSIPEDEDIENVISLPEGSTIRDIIPISKLSKITAKEVTTNNPATTLVKPRDNMLTGLECLNSPDLDASSELQPSTSNKNNSQILNFALSKNDFDDLLWKLLQTPKTVTNDEDECNSAGAANTELIKKGEIPSASTTESSNFVKNIHLPSVNKMVNYVQNLLAANHWDFEADNLPLEDDICMKTALNDLMSTKIVPFTFNMQKGELFRSEDLNQEAEVSSSDFNYQSETLQDISKDTATSEDLNFLTNQASTSHTSPKRKKWSTRSPKNKRRKVK